MGPPLRRAAFEEQGGAWYQRVAELLWAEFEDTYTVCMGMKAVDDVRDYLLALHGHGQGSAQGACSLLPYCLLVSGPEQLLGFCNVVHDDLGAPWSQLRPDLRPWLANVVVAPEHRGRGYGNLLVRDVVSAAESDARFAGGALHLWTCTDALCAWYARLGFATVETIGPLARHDEVVVMRRTLSRAVVR